jgi:PAS domain S-box-containing protein
MLLDYSPYFDKIFELTYDGIILVDADCKLLLINSNARKILNIRQQYLGEHIGRIIPSSRLPIAMESGHSSINRYQAIRDNLIILYSNYPIFNERKEVVGGVAIFRDMSGVDTIPTDIQTLKSLKETQLMLRAILNTTKDAVSVVDENGIYITVNKVFCELHDLKEEEIIGKNHRSLSVDTDSSIHERVLRSKVPFGKQFFNIPNQRDHIIHGVPITVGNELKGSVAVHLDMAEVNAISKQLNTASKRIKKLEGMSAFSDIITKDAKMLDQIEEARRIAQTPVTVLIHGEVGTEIDLLAKAIHDEGNRKYYPFIEVNCANRSVNDLENEIFGHISVYHNNKNSAFERAENGTLFMRGIDHMGIALQAKFLAAINEKQFSKPGMKNPVNINTRIIASTHADLKSAVEQGDFNKDLFFRLNFFSLAIPPLRERRSDIILLCEHMIQTLNDAYATEVKGLSQDAIMTLIEQPWRGNLRELRSCLDLAVVHLNHPDGWIRKEDLLLFDRTPNDGDAAETAEPPGRLTDYIGDKEKEFIIKALYRNKGSKTRTAKDLDISIRTLYYKMEKHGLAGF